MFCHLRTAQRREIQKKEIFFNKIMTQLKTNDVTNLNAMSLGLSGSSGFTAPGRLVIALGVDIVLERIDMIMFSSHTVYVKFVRARADPKNHKKH